ncbi:MAG: 3-oxoacyl-ACP reductase FabG [Nitrospirota bacterium]
MSMVLKQRVALITGGGTGIGLAISEAYLREGAQVAIASRNNTHLQAGAASARALGHDLMTVQLDVTDTAAVREAIESIARRYGRFDILVNNAGLSGRTPMTDPDDSRWLAILATNLNGAYFCSKQALRFMKDGEHGRIINMSSVLGRFGVAGYAAYCTAKHGLLGFTKALALEVADRGITVNAICPTWVDTPMARQGIEETAAVLGITPDEFRRQAVQAVPIGRMLAPSEVAELAVYVASPVAAGITGQALNICGGATAGAGG